MRVRAERGCLRLLACTIVWMVGRHWLWLLLLFVAQFVGQADIRIAGDRGWTCGCFGVDAYGSKQ